jgi:protein gp37
MAGNTKIEWTDHTFNPWVRCTKASPGCDNCYAEALMDKRFRRVTWGGERRRTSQSAWHEPRVWNRRAAEDGRPHRVFCASVADVFDNQVPEEWRTGLFALIAETPHLTWMLLTKRPQNIRKMLPATWDSGWPNVWLGTTTENQVEAERRIPLLQAIPATVRFLSAEPLLEAITPDLSGIGWIICGGEAAAAALD